MHSHAWNVKPREAIEIQKQLSTQVILHDDLGTVDYVAGVDVGFEDSGNVTRAAIVVLEFPSLALFETSIARCKTTFPYVPGLLSFRELPGVMKALDKLKRHPDLLFCDGQGYAHPRRFGIACHLGVISGIPSIGVGKTRLLGTHRQVANRRGAWQPLRDKSEIIGGVLRTRNNVKPVYVSVGHRIGLETAIAFVMRCTTRYRLPETTRLAHKFASGT